MKMAIGEERRKTRGTKVGERPKATAVSTPATLYYPSKRLLCVSRTWMRASILIFDERSTSSPIQYVCIAVHSP